MSEQAYPRSDFEVIVVDDGSPETLDLVVLPFQKRLNLILLRQKNGGPGSARNAGASVAKGRFLAFTDDDCAPEPDWLRVLDGSFQREPDSMLGGRTVNGLVDDPYASSSQMLVDMLYQFHDTAGPGQLRFFTANNLALPSADFASLGGFDPQFRWPAAEDRDLCDRWLHAGRRMAFVPGAVVQHAHPLSLSGFCRQHFTYGRGAVSYARLRRQPGGVASLWRTMNEGGEVFGVVGKILRFNGGLFASPKALALDKKALALLLQAAECNWADVEPAIFGTLLERAIDPKERHALGAHFTPRAYVERLVRPTIEEPLRADWDVVQAHVRQILVAGEHAKTAKASKDKLKEAVAVVREFHQKLCQTRVLDPACGSGNFLYVTLDLFKRLEGEVLSRLESLGETQTMMHMESVRVTPAQFHGIEIKRWGKEIAELVLWIGYLKWHFRTYSKTIRPEEPILRDYKNIECRDAILAYDGEPEPVLDEKGRPVTRWDGESMKANPVTSEQVPDESKRVPVYRYKSPSKAEWPEADFVVGNPPFLGKGKLRQAMGDGYAETLRQTYPDVPESADFVLYWWHKAAELARAGRLRRVSRTTFSPAADPRPAALTFNPTRTPTPWRSLAPPGGQRSLAGAAPETDAGRRRGCEDASVRRFLIVALVRRAAARDGVLVGGALALAGRNSRNRMRARTAGWIVRDAEIAHRAIRTGECRSITEGHAGRIGALEVEASDQARVCPGVDRGWQAAGRELRRSIQRRSVQRAAGLDCSGKVGALGIGGSICRRPGARHEEQSRNEPQLGSGSVHGISPRQGKLSRCQDPFPDCRSLSQTRALGLPGPALPRRSASERQCFA
jgi:GT2 family glycosyltransferase